MISLFAMDHMAVNGLDLVPFFPRPRFSTLLTLPLFLYGRQKLRLVLVISPSLCSFVWQTVFTPMAAKFPLCGLLSAYSAHISRFLKAAAVTPIPLSLMAVLAALLS